MPRMSVSVEDVMISRAASPSCCGGLHSFGNVKLGPPVIESCDTPSESHNCVNAAGVRPGSYTSLSKLVSRAVLYDITASLTAIKRA